MPEFFGTELFDATIKNLSSLDDPQKYEDFVQFLLKEWSARYKNISEEQLSDMRQQVEKRIKIMRAITGPGKYSKHPAVAEVGRDFDMTGTRASTIAYENAVKLENWIHCDSSERS